MTAERSSEQGRTFDLPDMDGIDLVEQVQAARPKLPVVLFTDSGNEAVASRAFSAGAADYVRKGGPDQFARLAAAIRDAVEEYRTWRTLQEREQRYRTLVEGSHDGIYIYQGDEFVFVNDRVCELTGYDEQELIGMEIWELVHPADRERVRAFGERRQRGEDAPNTYDARILTSDGETRYVHLSVESITYDGEWAALGSVRDVTARRRREEELHAEQEFIKTIIDTLEDVIFVCSLDGEILRWNDRLCDVTGYTDAELADMTVFDLLPESYHDQTVTALEAAVADGTGSIEAETVTKDGEHVPFEFRGSPLENSDGEVIGIAGVARDISERREREAELAQYKTIVEAVGDPVYALDESGNFTLVNEALAEITDYDEAELVGSHVSKVMRDQDVETAERLITELLASDQRTNVTFEMEAVTVDGEHLPCEDHLALLPAEDGFTGTGGVVRDISERKAREQKLRRQNDRLDQFAGVVSHDLRNPLNVILGRLDPARRSGDPEHFDAIERSAERMERLIEDLLTLAREGETVGEGEPVSFGRAVDRAWRNVDTGESTLELVGDGGTVLADSSRLASLLENLFRNAVEHGLGAETDREPDLTVRTGLLEEGGGDPSGDPRRGFFVEDDGVGIPEDECVRVFEEGYTNSPDGTGLGLVIVEGIADAHDWDVDVTTGELGGARFEITGVELFED
jgi:PAS domain S-box-containing protein